MMKTKKYRRDSGSDLSPEELEKAIALFKATQPLFGQNVPTSDEDEEEQELMPVDTTEEVVEDAEPEIPKDKQEEAPTEVPTEAPTDAPAEAPTAPKAEGGAPSADLNAQVIAVLEKTIADLKAASGQSADSEEEEQEFVEDAENGEIITPEDEEGAIPEEDEEMQTDADDLSKSLAKRNCDSVDSIVSQKLNVCRMGDKLNLDGLDAMSLVDGKKAVIKAVFPGMRLDGKSKAYVNAAYDMATLEIKKREETTEEQRKQMFSGRRTDSNDVRTMAESARQRMLDREGGN